MRLDSLYVPVELGNFTLDDSAGVDLFIKADERYVLYRDATVPFRTIDSQRLRANGVNNLWIRIATEEGFHSGKELTFLLGLPDDQLAADIKARVLYGSAINTVRRAFANPAGKPEMEDLFDLVDLSLNFLESSPTALHVLISVMKHDYSVYTHGVNVATLALVLGRRAGITDISDLRTLGLGTLLHDVGKLKVPAGILTKPGPLTNEEWGFIRQHPLWGLETLAVAGDLPADVIKLVGQHHERLDGSGYPDGTVPEDQHGFVKIIALADSYEALTGQRPYRNPLTPFGALSILKQDVGSKLDYETFVNLVSLLGSPN